MSALRAEIIGYYRTTLSVQAPAVRLQTNRPARPEDKKVGNGGTGEEGEQRNC